MSGDSYVSRFSLVQPLNADASTFSHPDGICICLRLIQSINVHLEITRMLLEGMYTLRSSLHPANAPCPRVFKVDGSRILQSPEHCSKAKSPISVIPAGKISVAGNEVIAKAEGPMLLMLDGILVAPHPMTSCWVDV